MRKRINETGQREYKASASHSVGKPAQRPNNPRFGDNTLEEKAELSPETESFIIDLYYNIRSLTDEETAVVEVADRIGMKGEEVEAIIKRHEGEFVSEKKVVEYSDDFDDYNDQPERGLPPKISDGTDEEFLSDREVRHTESKYNVSIEWLDSSYNTQITKAEVEAETSKEAQQKAIAELKSKNGGRLNMIDVEVELAEAKELTITKNGEVSGASSEFEDEVKAREYLERHPFGVLTNDDYFNEASFIFIGNDGKTKFYDTFKERVEDWSWETDIQDIQDDEDGERYLSLFYYQPANEFFPQVYDGWGGLEFFEQLRSGVNESLDEDTLEEEKSPVINLPTMSRAVEIMETRRLGVIINRMYGRNSFVANTSEGLKFYSYSFKKGLDFDWKVEYRDTKADTTPEQFREFLTGFQFVELGHYFSEMFTGDTSDPFFSTIVGFDDLNKVEEAFGSEIDGRGRKRYLGHYAHRLAMLPVPGLYSLDDLETHDYWPTNGKDNDNGWILMSIETPKKPRLTFVTTYDKDGEGAKKYKPGQKCLTFHSQTGAEREGTILGYFHETEYLDPNGRKEIKKMMAAAGMNPERKYSTRTLK